MKNIVVKVNNIRKYVQFEIWKVLSHKSRYGSDCTIKVQSRAQHT